MDPETLYDREIRKIHSQFCFKWQEGNVYNLNDFGGESNQTGTKDCVLTVMVNPTNRIYLVEDDQVQTYLCLLFLSMLKPVIIKTGCDVRFLVPLLNSGGNIQPDGKWSGFYGYLHNRSADLLLNPGSFQIGRMPYLDFGYVMPIKTVLSLISFSNKHILKGFESIFAIFELDVWLLIIFVFILTFTIKMIDLWLEHGRLCAFHRKCSDNRDPSPSEECTHLYLDYSNIPLVFFCILLGFSASLSKIYKVFDQLILFWIWTAFIMRQMFLSKSQSLVISDSPLKIDSFSQLEHYLDDYHLYVESTTLTKTIFTKQYPRFKSEIEDVHYTEMFDHEFMRQFCYPSLRYNYIMFHDSKHQVQSKDFDLLGFMPDDKLAATTTTMAPPSSDSVALKNSTNSKQWAELGRFVKKRHKRSSALVAREVNIDQLKSFYNTITLFKAHQASVVWHANFVLRHGLKPQIRDSLGQIFMRFHQFGLFERIYNSEILQQKYILMAETLYEAYERNNNASGVAVDVEALQRELVRHVFEKSLSDPRKRRITEESDEAQLTIEKMQPHIILYLLNSGLALLCFLCECGYFFLHYWCGTHEKFQK